MLRFKRGFAQVSAVSYTRKGEQPAFAPAAIKAISKTQAGVTVATQDKQGPASSVAVFIKAGSRFDSSLKPGVAHLAKRSVFRNLKDDTVVRTVLDAELRGNTLYSSVGREYIAVGSEFLRDDVVDVVPTLFTNIFNDSFEVYEFLNAVEGTAEQGQAALADPKTAVVEKLHQVAFRNGLGNPIYATSEALDGLNRQDVKDHIKNYATADRIAVVGTGVEHEELKALVEKALANIKLASTSSATSVKSTYFGGESRIEGGPQSTALYAVAYPGASNTSSEYPASLVLKALLGGNKTVKYGSLSSVSGVLGDASTESTLSSAFSHSYSDAGLIGFLVEGETDEVKQVVSKSIAALKGLASTISPEALETAKKAAILEADSLSRDGVLEALSKEAAGGVAALSDASAISSVTAADVQKLAKAAISSKPSIVAYGNLLRLPHASDF